MSRDLRHPTVLQLRFVLVELRLRASHHTLLSIPPRIKLLVLVKGQPWRNQDQGGLHLLTAVRYPSREIRFSFNELLSLLSISILI